MPKETLYRLTVIVLLASILFVQARILAKTPNIKPAVEQVTFGDVYGVEAKQESREDIQQKIYRVPLVRVMGSVTVDGTVTIDNEPLQVQIVR